jgi:hypothetical protein
VAGLEGPASGDGIAHGSFSFNFGSCRTVDVVCIPHIAAVYSDRCIGALLPHLEATENDVAAVLPIIGIVW